MIACFLVDIDGHQPPGKDPVEEIVGAALAPGRPTLMQLEEAVARRALRSPRALRHRGALERIVRALHAQSGLR